MQDARGEGHYSGPEPETSECAATPAFMVAARDRNCPEWFPYREFQSPAEHRAERDMMRIEEERKAHQTRLAEMELEVHKGTQQIQADSLGIAKALKDIAAATQDIHVQTQAVANKIDTFIRNWTIFAFAIVVVGVIFVVATYLFVSWQMRNATLVITS